MIDHDGMPPLEAEVPPRLNPRTGSSPSPRKQFSTIEQFTLASVDEEVDGQVGEDEDDEEVEEERFVLRRLLERERKEASQLMSVLDEQRREIELLQQKLHLKQQECTQLSSVSARLAQNVSKLDSVEQRDILHERFAKRLHDSSRLVVELSSEKTTLFAASTCLVIESLEQAASKAKKLEAQVNALEKQLLQKQRSLEASRRAMLTAWEGDATPTQKEKDSLAPHSLTSPGDARATSRRQPKTTVF
jgi:hypothetical protein